MEAYEKYRWFITSEGKLVIGGKSAEQNEKIMASVRKDSVVMHTSAPGSPFCIISNPTKEEIEEVAIFTACFGQEWKRGKKKTSVDIFRGNQVSKKKDMKTGTFGVSGKIEHKEVKLELALDFQKKKLRAVPIAASKSPILIITPGNLNKEQAIKEIARIIKEKLCYPVTKDEIASAIPSDKIGVREI
mgnify:CR=1 FL=1